MKRFLIFMGAMMMVLGTFGVVGATTFQFQPDDHHVTRRDTNTTDLWDLRHGKYYTWGIDWDIPAGETIVGASLSFNDIRNWNSGVNDLWVHLLDNPPAGASQYSDPQSGQVDYFGSNGVLLNQWHNLPDTPQDITFDFGTTALAALNNYAADGLFGFGIDPDCHFYNNGIKLSVETAAAPEPATMLLLGTGLIGLAGFRKKFKKA